MERVRILVVDDSSVVRKLLSETLNQDLELEVVGSAGDGRIALQKIASLKPDLVTLDVEMPVMNGLETLAELRKSYVKLPVIMFSTLTERGAAATLEALSLGASDYATKPTSIAGAPTATAAIRAELIPKIKALCRRNTLKAFLAPPVPPQHKTISVPTRVEIVAIGTSTGGPNALAKVLPQLSRDFPVPIVTVQHMPPIFTKALAARLTSLSQLPVEEASAGTALAPGRVWIAPGDFHMTVKRSGFAVCLELNQDERENSCRPAVDVLFRSVAETYGRGVLAVVMTGMGSDGVIGAQRIRQAGGGVIVQDEASSIVWGMPGLVFAAGAADAVYPLDQLAQEITRRALRGRPARSAVAAGSRFGVSAK